MIAPIDAVPPELRETYTMIVSAYPKGISEDVYFALLQLLSENMSIRALAGVLSAITSKPYERIYNDVLGVLSPYVDRKTDTTVVEEVRRKLAGHGYEEWLKAE